jgi:glycosyltransferase involved in cell wall biosynthesis
MRVIHLSHQDQDGGAAVAAWRLHQGLTGAGIESSMMVARKLGDDDAVTPIPSPRGARLRKRFDRLPRRWLRTANQGLHSPGWIGAAVWKSVNQAAPDIAHLHWINDGFVRAESLAKFEMPLVWSLHDMWAFAGAEHYVDGCTRYAQGYLPHNRAPHESGFDLNRWTWERKRKAWRTVSRLTLFAVSEWMACRARESVLFADRPIKVLYNGIDEQVFKPVDQAAARVALGLPPDIPLILYGALDATSDRRKGFDLVTAALSQLRTRDSTPAVAVFGNSPQSALDQPALAGLPTHYLGRVHDPRRLALIYAACDVMVVPSRQEAFGQTALEALACGTPVAAFRVGGLPEIVEHQVSGFLAPPFDTAELARGIRWLASLRGTAASRAMAEAGRAKVLREFTLGIQARRCEALYAEINSTSS